MFVDDFVTQHTPEIEERVRAIPLWHEDKPWFGERDKWETAAEDIAARLGRGLVEAHRLDHTPSAAAGGIDAALLQWVDAQRVRIAAAELKRRQPRILTA